MPDNVEVAIVGGGIVGVATALALVRQGVTSVTVLETAERVATHQTGHNSGVIHSGLYYKAGSHKAGMCVTGRDAMYAFCEAEGVPTRQCGKLVVATSEDELPRLAILEERGRANGLAGISRLSRDEVRRLDPEVSAVEALWISQTGVVDFTAVTSAMTSVLARSGVSVRTGHQVLAVRAAGAGSRVETTRGSLEARLVVTCAGLQSDRVTRLCGVDPGIAIIPFRGEYYELIPARSHLIRNLVYPVPDPDLPFLGVHFTRRIDGRVEAGPNAVLAFKREGYSRHSFAGRDVAEMLAFPGFWRMAGQQWRTGLDELGRSLSKHRFTTALQKLAPGIREGDLRWGGCGVRAQAVDRWGRLLDDFHIVDGERSLHLVNAPSPAATASLSIGSHLAARIRSKL